ncbi:carboxypeptidase regulatory-like domain-containing protein [Planctomyces sp. SH-PL62]|uniref:carboxypeptidase regulatory-like domain-containing protein n=1 Tax=Planctomyces sp. SH-PL62 TaxID=1636152 RepID=UPI00078D5203|nr:carboxypeptidase regulatory-like domain-containing protein [Planctomyces sp. SH-PL62]AMV36376.1 Thiol-disulfide oxidoreductase ResA [Planctomyces sp. SH-PL62]
MVKARIWWAVLVGAMLGGEAVGEPLQGSVAAENGKPAAGARVWAARLWIQQLDRVEAVAGDEGNFTLELAPGTWLLNASLGDQGLGRFQTAEVQAGREPDPARLRLSPQGLLRGRLIEAESGRPIAGARFVLDDGRDPTTDQDGRFEVPALGRENSHEAFVVAPGRERKRVLFEMSEGPTTDLEVPIPRGAKVVGRVLDLDGRPVPDARVGRSTSGSGLSLTGLWVRADAEGRFEYDGVVSDRSTWLGAAAPGFQDAERSAFRTGADDPPFALDFRLARKPSADAPKPAAEAVAKASPPPAEAPNRRHVVGVALGPDGRPVVGASARWGVDRSNETIETRTDERGRFRLAFVPVEAGVVCVLPADGALAPGLAQVPAVGDQEVKVELAKGLTLKGIVHDSQGEPFAGVMVLPTVDVPGQRQMALFERRTETDAEGRFDVSGLPAEGVKFTFLRQGVSDLRDQELPLDRDADVLMSAAGAIRGKVVGPDGEPVRNFRVLLNGPRERKPDDVFGGFFAGFCGIGLSYTSDDGSFLIRNLGANSVQRVTVLASGFGEVSIDRVIAEPLDRLPADRAVAFSLPKPHALRVRAVEVGTEKPVAGVRAAVILEDPAVDANFAWGYHDSAWGDSVQARGDAQGVADFTPLSFAEGTITVQAPGYGRRHVGWRDGAEEVVVELTPEAVVSGELRDSGTGRPLESAVVNLALVGGGQVSTTVEPADAGRFRVDGLPPGEYGLSISVPFGPTLHTERLTLKAGQEARRDLKLSREEAAAAMARPRPAAPRFKLGDAAPDFEARTLDDKPTALKEFRGKFVLLDFWATWCGPCVAEAPHLQAVHEAFGDDPRFAMISLSLDATRAEVVKFLKDKPQPWTQVFLGDWSTDEVTKTYGVDGIPAIFLLDPDGKIVAQDLRGAKIKEAVARALEKE